MDRERPGGSRLEDRRRGRGLDSEKPNSARAQPDAETGRQACRTDSAYLGPTRATAPTSATYVANARENTSESNRVVGACKPARGAGGHRAAPPARQACAGCMRRPTNAALRSCLRTSLAAGLGAAALESGRLAIDCQIISDSFAGHGRPVPRPSLLSCRAVRGRQVLATRRRWGIAGSESKPAKPDGANAPPGLLAT